MCSEVIMNRQKPSRFADVLNMCCEVLFAKVFLYKITLSFLGIFAASYKVGISIISSKNAYKYMKKNCNF